MYYVRVILELFRIAIFSEPYYAAATAEINVWRNSIQLQKPLRPHNVSVKKISSKNIAKTESLSWRTLW